MSLLMISLEALKCLCLKMSSSKFACSVSACEIHQILPEAEKLLLERASLQYKDLLSICFTLLSATNSLHEPLENISEEPTPTISLRFASKQVFLTAHAMVLRESFKGNAKPIFELRCSCHSSCQSQQPVAFQPFSKKTIRAKTLHSEKTRF